MTHVLEVEGLTKTFRAGGSLFRRGAFTHALDDVSFLVREGGRMGLVGESGSGKSTIARILCRLIRPDGGRVRYRGADILDLRGEEALALSRRIQIVFQDPMSSLNPRWKVFDLLAEGMRIHRLGSPAEIAREVTTLLERCGLPGDAGRRYPHEFSGGQRQRIAIARALAVRPDVLILDEPVSALDMSVRAQIMRFLEELQQDLRMTFIFISHDLALVERVCDEMVVLQHGRIVDRGLAREVCLQPSSAYTRTLIEAHPEPDPSGRRWRDKAITEEWRER
ncbi:MAG: ABC transporter ATP-binding protein [Variibacter sp.]|nr:ABC transporter ATP-binding protein [Variibacter sp.]